MSNNVQNIHIYLIVKYCKNPFEIHIDLFGKFGFGLKVYLKHLHNNYFYFVMRKMAYKFVTNTELKKNHDNIICIFVRYSYSFIIGETGIVKIFQLV